MIELKSTKVRIEVIFVAIILALAGALYTWLISHANKEFYTEVRGMTTEARRNPFLAARFFVEKNGGKINLLRDFALFDETLDPLDTIIITNSRKPLSERRLQAINDFVTAGGHLILQAIEVFDDEKSISGGPIMDQLGARFYEYDSEIEFDLFGESSDTNIANDTSENTEGTGSTYAARFKFEADKQDTQVEFSPNAYLIDASGDAMFQGGTDDSDHVIRYEQGEGNITILSDLNFWTNKQIARADHAMFLHQLIRGSNNVWIVYNPQIESLPALVWQHAYFIVIAAAFYLIFIIWHSQVKTGPVFPQFTTTRRQILQHIQAAADFKHQHSSLETLLERTREHLNLLAKRKHRGFEQLPRNEQVDLLNNWTKVSKGQLSRALFEASNDQWLFQEQMKTLQTAANYLHGKHR